jgi:crotonobetainyl-CoA:carnitine CoA-transferase CaiB-like acyl-CoA transferase
MGVASALVKKDRTGEGSVIDVSLLGMASWVLAGNLLAALHGVEPVQDPGRSCTTNPLTNTYRTRDGHWISLVTMQADRYRPSLCRVLGRADLADDPRFVNVGVRAENYDACIAALDEAFASADPGECGAASSSSTALTRACTRSRVRCGRAAAPRTSLGRPASASTPRRSSSNWDAAGTRSSRSRRPRRSPEPT